MSAPETETLEVRCAGCGETLEVELGMTEFACPGCAMPQSLPPELMPPPPPPRPRRALPLHGGRGGAAGPVPGGPMPCGGCGAVLAVPRGLRRLACPACGADLAVDGDRLRLHGCADPGGIQVILPAVAVAAAPASLRRSEVQEEAVSQAIQLRRGEVGRYSKPIHLEQRRPFHAYSVHREESICSLRSNTKTTSHAGYAKGAPINQSFHREESRIKLSSETVSRHDISKKARLSDGSASICIEKIQEHTSKVNPAPQSQEPFKYSVHAEEAYGQHQSGLNGSDGSHEARHAAISRTMEKEAVEPPSETAVAEQVHILSCGNTIGWNQKRKRSSKTSRRNHKKKDRDLTPTDEGIHLTCSKHSTMEPEGIRNSNLIKQQSLSPNESQFDHANIDKIVVNICTSSLPQKQMPQAGLNDLDSSDAHSESIFVNHGTSQDNCFRQCYSQCQADAIGTLANKHFRSEQMHPGSFNGTFPHDKSSAQEWSNPSSGFMHKQQMQESSSDESLSEQVQVECHHSKIAGCHKNTEKGVMYMSNEGNYIKQVTSVTACRNHTTSSLLIATPFPRVTLPSVLTKQSVHEQPPHNQSPENLHSQIMQDAQAVGRGSINKLSKKRRGRGPTKLIEPRKESDRPVLTPNNLDTWDIHPPCPKVASTISALLKQWHPGSAYMPSSEQTNEVHQGQLVLHFHQYHSDTRDIIMDEFLQRYKWAPGQEAQCLKLFDRKVVRQFTGLLCDEKRRARVELAASRKVLEASDSTRSKRQTNLHNEGGRGELKQPRRDPAAVGKEDDDPLQWKQFPPEWMLPKWWEMLCEHWASEEVLHVSAQKRKNRYTGGFAQHTAGSRSIAMHRQLMIIENGGKPVSDLEVFNKTHKRGGDKGVFVTKRARRAVEGCKRRFQEAGDTELDTNLVRAEEIGGRNRGRYYGPHGIIDKARVGDMSKSIPGSVGQKTSQQMFTQEQVRGMINHAMQQLNETWEKRFQSLEQTMHDMASLDDPQANPT